METASEAALESPCDGSKAESGSRVVVESNPAADVNVAVEGCSRGYLQLCRG